MSEIAQTLTQPSGASGWLGISREGRKEYEALSPNAAILVHALKSSLRTTSLHLADREMQVRRNAQCARQRGCGRGAGGQRAGRKWAGTGGVEMGGNGPTVGNATGKKTAGGHRPARTLRFGLLWPALACFGLLWLALAYFGLVC